MNFAFHFCCRIILDQLLFLRVALFNQQRQKSFRCKKLRDELDRLHKASTKVVNWSITTNNSRSISPNDQTTACNNFLVREEILEPKSFCFSRKIHRSFSHICAENNKEEEEARIFANTCIKFFLLFRHTFSVLIYVVEFSY